LLPSLLVIGKKVLTATSQSHDEREKAITFCFACCFSYKTTFGGPAPEKMGIENFLWPWQQFMLHLLRLKLSIFYFKTPGHKESRSSHIICYKFTSCCCCNDPKLDGTEQQSGNFLWAVLDTNSSFLIFSSWINKRIRMEIFLRFLKWFFKNYFLYFLENILFWLCFINIQNFIFCYLFVVIIIAYIDYLFIYLIANR